jgi:hypothetical protein
MIRGIDAPPLLVTEDYAFVGNEGHALLRSASMRPLTGKPRAL